jgi:hypothetical protein
MITDIFDSVDENHPQYTGPNFSENLADILFQKPIAPRWRNKFGSTGTLDDDLLELKKKWLGTQDEVLVQHMIDSLIIFNHNRKSLQSNTMIVKSKKHLTLRN